MKQHDVSPLRKNIKNVLSFAKEYDKKRYLLKDPGYKKL